MTIDHLMRGAPPFARPALEQEYGTPRRQAAHAPEPRQSAARVETPRSTSVPAYAAAVFFLLAGCEPPSAPGAVAGPGASPQAPGPAAAFAPGTFVCTCEPLPNLGTEPKVRRAP